MRSRPLLSLVLAVAALAPWRARAAVELNVVSSVQVKDAGSAIVVTIQGSRPPNFTTFSMADPPRFVIDLSESRFQGVPEDVVAQDGVVNVVKNLSYGSDATAIARVMIAFHVEVEPPDVRAEGNALVVRVVKPGAPAVAQADGGQKLGSEPEASATPAAADRAAAEARAREAEARAAAERAEAEAKASAEAQARADAEAKAKAEADAKAKADAEASAAAQAKAAEPKPQPDPASEARTRARAEMRARVAHVPPPGPDDTAEAAATSPDGAPSTSGAKLDEAAAGAPTEAEQKIRDDEPAALQAAAPDARAQAATEVTAAQQMTAQVEAERAAQEQRDAEARAEAARQSQEAFERQKAEADAQAKAQAEASARAAEPAPEPTAAPSRTDRLAAEAPRARLKEIGFKQLPGISRVFVRTTVTPRFTVQDVGEDTIRVELENTRAIRRNDTRFLDTSFFPSAVVLVTPRSRGTSLVVDIKLKQRVPFQQKIEGDMLALDFERPGTATAAAPARSGDPSAAAAGEGEGGTKLDPADAAPEAAAAPAR